MMTLRPVCLLVAALAAACTPRGQAAPGDSTKASPFVSAATPAPPFDAFDRAPVDSVLAYARSLAYDDDTGVSDSQPLAIFKPGGKRCPEECAYGPLVSIHPEVGSAFLTDDELRQGRVIARFVNHDTVAYEKLNIAPGGTTYYVVVNTGGVQWTGFFVSADPARGSLSRVPHPIYVDPPHMGRYTRSTARWLWVSEDEQGWATCGIRCCKTGP